ncbi:MULTISPECIES: bifunctional GrpB family protein/GNAT family N-acetyltransferase [unclassified Legionella]|uniref:bifunctional GrpB family protein/GNAT family N-acetyltransferase n=1 Tax=unclassified Legionella TaxID=2622702 RepID=UPI0013EFB023|nr:MULTISPECIES: bifunctional GrpB family protein/GNAT family N-acetyltransferase [unclassified Legionella]MDI9819703.1 bifunctional GrpB family protein/GNAT family N-acetyltransferase [Legionella sp. PL877]
MNGNQIKTASSQKVEIVPYDKHWPEIFKNEANRIQKALGECIEEIYHIGSTSIPDMPAKPAIDMMLVLDNLDDIQFISEKLTHLSYDPVRRQIIPHVSFFTKRQAPAIRFHLHLHERGSPQINRHVNFRDYVIQHPDMAHDYAQLKIQLAAQFVDDIYSYVSGKDKLVQKIDAKAKLWVGRKKDYLPQNTGPMAKDWPHEKLVKAMEANLNVHMTHFAQYLNQVELVRVPGSTLVNSRLADDTFNYVVDADFSSVNAEEKISELTDYFNQKNSPFSWWISPHDQPDDLPTHLENNGYENTENNCAMYFDLDTWDGEVFPIPKLNIIRATDEKTLHDFALVLANDKSAFKTYFSWVASVLTDDDPIEYYVGYVDGKPVVRGLSCYFAQVAGLHWLSTVPSERRKGYGRAMQEYRLKRAKDLGYHIAVLQASSNGYPLYQQLGYKECGYFREYKPRQVASAKMRGIIRST